MGGCFIGDRCYSAAEEHESQEVIDTVYRLVEDEPVEEEQPATTA
jgi:hypothetical protein